jgi:hypothetical protein
VLKGQLPETAFTHSENISKDTLTAMESAHDQSIQKERIDRGDFIEKLTKNYINELKKSGINISPEEQKKITNQVINQTTKTLNQKPTPEMARQKIVELLTEAQNVCKEVNRPTANVVAKKIVLNDNFSLPALNDVDSANRLLFDPEINPQIKAPFLIAINTEQKSQNLNYNNLQPKVLAIQNAMPKNGNPEIYIQASAFLATHLPENVSPENIVEASKSVVAGLDVFALSPDKFNEILQGKRPQYFQSFARTPVEKFTYSIADTAFGKLPKEWQQYVGQETYRKIMERVLNNPELLTQEMGSAFVGSETFKYLKDWLNKNPPTKPSLSGLGGVANGIVSNILTQQPLPGADLAAVNYIRSLYFINQKDSLTHPDNPFTAAVYAQKFPGLAFLAEPHKHPLPANHLAFLSLIANSKFQGYNYSKSSLGMVEWLKIRLGSGPKTAIIFPATPFYTTWFSGVKTPTVGGAGLIGLFSGISSWLSHIGLSKLIGTFFGGPIGTAIATVGTPVIRGIGGVLGAFVNGSLIPTTNGITQALGGGYTGKKDGLGMSLLILIGGSLIAFMFIFPYFSSRKSIQRNILAQTGGGPINYADAVNCDLHPENPRCSTTPCDSNKQDCSWPTSGIITQGPNTTCNSLASHYSTEAIDIAAPDGTAVYLPIGATVDEVFDGCATNSGDIGNSCGGLYGNHIFVTTDAGYGLKFGHLEQGSIKVTENTHYDKATLIGRVDQTGNSTGPHLHYEYVGAGSINSILPFTVNRCANNVSGCQTCPYPAVGR